MSETDEKLINFLDEIRKWVTFLGWQQASKILEENIKSDRDILIYHLTDGEHGIRDIISKAEKYGIKTSYGGIHGLWQRWVKLGIVESIPYGAGFRQKKLFDLEKFGFEIPKIHEENTDEE